MPLKTKHIESLHSSKLLIDSKNFNSSVHCSYYSTIQLMIYILMDKFGWDQENINREWDKSPKSFHVWIFKLTVKELRVLRIKPNHLENLMNNFQYLKEYRIDADYKEEIIDTTIAKSCLSKAGLINRTLKINHEYEF